MHDTEKAALAMTKQHFHKERGHKELRKMTHVQLRKFINEFTASLKGGSYVVKSSVS